MIAIYTENKDIHRVINVVGEYKINVTEMLQASIRRILSQYVETIETEHVREIIGYAANNHLFMKALKKQIDGRILSYVDCISNNDIIIRMAAGKIFNNVAKILYDENDEKASFEQQMYKNGSYLLKSRILNRTNTIKSASIFLDTESIIKVQEKKATRFYIGAIIKAVIHQHRYMTPLPPEYHSITITFTTRKTNNNIPPQFTECHKIQLNNTHQKEILSISQIAYTDIDPKVRRLYHLDTAFDINWYNNLNNKKQIHIINQHINLILFSAQRIHRFLDCVPRLYPAGHLVKNTGRIVMNNKLKERLKSDEYLQFTGGVYQEFDICIFDTVGLYYYCKQIVFKMTLKIPTCYHYINKEKYNMQQIKNLCLTTNALDKNDTIYVMFDLS